MVNEVELDCLVTSIPENIRVDVKSLNVSETITAGQLELPPDVTLVTDPDTGIATVRAKVEEVEEVEEVEDAESAEPEVIAREKAEEEEA